jgi:hypothetical protein
MQSVSAVPRATLAFRQCRRCFDFVFDLHTDDLLRTYKPFGNVKLRNNRHFLKSQESTGKMPKARRQHPTRYFRGAHGDLALVEK